MPHAVDVASVLAVFWLPPGAIFTYLILREVRKLRRQRDLDRLEAEALAAEGYPPPGPPTTVQPGLDELD